MLFRKKKKPMSHTSDGTAPEQTTAPNVPNGPDTRDVVDQVLNDGGPISETERLQGELDAAKAEHALMHDKYVRLHAEFDNFRKRTAKERLDLLQSAGADAIKSILPVLDDFERAIANNTAVEDAQALKQGFALIHQKLAHTLAGQGLKPMEAKGASFDPDLHEAIAQAPAPSADLKGKVLDVVENGYLLNDKVLRYAKVVVGQ